MRDKEGKSDLNWTERLMSRELYKSRLWHTPGDKIIHTVMQSKDEIIDRKEAVNWEAFIRYSGRKKAIGR